MSQESMTAREFLDSGLQLRTSNRADIALPLPKARKEKTEAPGTKMNKLETRYVTEVLMPRKYAREIERYKFGTMRFRLADGSWYKPDFIIELPNGRVECHETKGFCREAALVRIKVAADRHPAFRFIMVRRINSEWVYQEF